MSSTYSSDKNHQACSEMLSATALMNIPTAFLSDNVNYGERCNVQTGCPRSSRQSARGDRRKFASFVNQRGQRASRANDARSCAASGIWTERTIRSAECRVRASVMRDRSFRLTPLRLKNGAISPVMGR
jgi:hypothetical protein